MKLTCKRCNSDEVFEVPNLSLVEKKKLMDINASSPLLAIQKIKTSHTISLRNAKFIVLHLNKEVTKCHRCNRALGTQEYTSCPKCKALNFNWNLDF